MPYFAYTTCLHLYETLGWWRTGGLRVVHFAEEWNELHHRTFTIPVRFYVAIIMRSFLTLQSTSAFQGLFVF